MTTAHVQLSDDSKTILSVFSCPQDPETFPNQAELETDDPRYVAYKTSLTESMQAALP